MHQDDKRRLQERQQRASKKHKTFEQLKKLKEQARQKRVERRKTAPDRWRSGEELDEGEPFEPRQSSTKARSPSERTAPAKDETVPAHDETVVPAGALETGEVVSVARTRVRLALGLETLEAAFVPGLELAVGDRVGFERSPGELALVRIRYPRTSWLARPDPARPARQLVLAANIELVVCVVAAREPRWKPGFVDRVLLATEAGGARALIVVNKLDLLEQAERSALAAELEPYSELGAGVIAVSAASGEGLESLSEATAGRMCAFVGPSGAGKSSLLNALDPTHARVTGAVRSSDGKGRHTTSASQLVRLANGAKLIDTPGVRQFGILALERRTLPWLFPEFAEHARACRFRDCLHTHEPDCAVLVAAARGVIPRARFESYQRILASLEDG